MKAVRHTPGGVAVVDVDMADPGESGIVLPVVASGICSADLNDSGLVPEPVTLGHEFSARLPDGRVVAVQPNVACGECDQCAAGTQQLCRTLRPTILGFFRDGGMADAVVVDPSCVVELPAGVDGRDACLVEPLAVALHTVHRVDPEPGARVLVVGGGAIGLACVAVLHDLGHPVAVVARHEHQRRAAEALGAGPDDGDGWGGEADVVIEAAGTQSALDLAIERIRPGGAVGLAATYASGVALGIEVSLKEVNLVPAFTYGRHDGRREFDGAAAVLARSPELAGVLITHRFPLADAAEAFRVASDRAAGAIKVVLEP